MTHLILRGICLCMLVMTIGSCNDDDNEGQPTPLAIGDFHEGGVIFYLDESGENGLVVSISDQSFEAAWGCPPISVQGAGATSIGAGAQNTIAINNSCGTAGIAAALCAELELNGFSDWFLPSQDELNELYIHAGAIAQSLTGNGGNPLEGTEYWTSSQQTSNTILAQNFNGGSQLGYPQEQLLNVRAIRAF